jgi:glycosyltransferase involved in cell wall biosynthesis
MSAPHSIPNWLLKWRRLGAGDSRYHWLGALSAGGDPPDASSAATCLLLPSLMEGGANVLIEAVTSGVPVLGSDISGNRGMLGADYPGWFARGDAARLAALIVQGGDAMQRYYSSLSATLRRAGPPYVLPAARMRCGLQAPRQ